MTCPVPVSMNARRHCDPLCIPAMPMDRIRHALELWFVGPEGPQMLFTGRVLAFDERAALQWAALQWAALMADGRRIGQSRSPLDMIIASVAQAHGCTIVTDNERDFAGLDAINPMRRSGT